MRKKKHFIRQLYFDRLWQRLHSSINLIEIMIGPRQVGKTTLAAQICEQWGEQHVWGSADRLLGPSDMWIAERWAEARQKAKKTKTAKPVLLVLDEVQKLPRWSDHVKYFFDEDKRLGIDIRVLILGSASLLIRRGYEESLAGRFWLHRIYAWSYREVSHYFDLSLEQYWLYGGYPQPLDFLVHENNIEQWSIYVQDTLVEPVLGKDILLMEPIQKPALLRQLFGLALLYPSQVLSYQKMLGQLSDAGNTTTLANYLHLLTEAFLVVGLSQWTNKPFLRKQSSPKFVVLDNAFVMCLPQHQQWLEKIEKTHERWSAWQAFRGHLVENAVGAKLYQELKPKSGELFYWKDRDDEVDFVVQHGNTVVAVEVKSVRLSEADWLETRRSLSVFKKKFPQAQLLVLHDGLAKIEIKNLKGLSVVSMSLHDFFENPGSVLRLEAEVIQEHLRQHRIIVKNKYLQEDLVKNNVRALSPILYLINFVDIKITYELLKNISGVLDRSQYFNKLTECAALQVVDAEGWTCTEYEPGFRKEKKSDFLVQNTKGKEVRVEVKDLSAETQASDEARERFKESAESDDLIFTTKSMKQKKEWLWKKMEECADKKADVLIARIPVWSPAEIEWKTYFYEDMIRELFKDSVHVKENVWDISPDIPKEVKQKNRNYPHTIYLLKLDENSKVHYVKLILSHLK